MPTLHMHLDESGNFDFSPTGTKYYVFTVAWTYNPSQLARHLESFRYQLLKQGHNLPEFHATTDRQLNRDAVVRLLTSDNSWRFAAVVVQKNKVNPALRDPADFYPYYGAMAIRFVLRGRVRLGSTSTVLIYTDSIPVRQNKRAVEKAIKVECARDLPSGVPWHIYHHPSTSNAWLQVADYACWAVQKKWESVDLRTYSQLQTRLAAPELDALKHNQRTYY